MSEDPLNEPFIPEDDWDMLSVKVKFRLGEVVYASYSPQKVGVVTEILSVPEDFPDINTVVRVRWLKKGNPEEDVRVVRLNLLTGLIEETREKLRNHRRRHRRAIQMALETGIPLPE